MSNREHERDHSSRPRNGAQARKNSEFLPSPEVLEAYNYIVEGSAARIIAMFEAEQKHRHAWEDNALKTHTFSSVLGQILGYCVSIVIFISAAIIAVQGNATLGVFVWVFGIAVIIMAGMVWIFTRSVGQKLFGRTTTRSKFRAERDFDTEGKGVYVERRGRQPNAESTE